MEIIVNKKILMKTLNDLFKLNKKYDLIFVAENNHIEIIIEDGDLVHNYIFQQPLSVIKKGFCKVNLNILIEVINFYKNPVEEIILEIKGNKLFIDTMSIDLIPCEKEEIEKIKNKILKGDSNIEIPENKLKEGINKVKHAISKDKTKPTLNGVLFKQVGDDLELVSIDGYRMVVHKIKNINCRQIKEVIIFGEQLVKLEKILNKKSTEDVLIHISNNKIQFTINNMSCMMDIIEDEFVDYKKLLPKEYNTKVVINNSVVNYFKNIDSIKTETKRKLIKLNLRQDNLKLIFENDKQNILANIPIEFEGEELDIAFNNKYIFDIFKNINEKNVIMKFTTNVNPVLITEEFTKYLVLPVRIHNNI